MKLFALLTGALVVTAGAPGQSLSDLRREMLAAHNSARELVGVPPLTWSTRLAGVAQAWADSLFSKEQFSHSPNSPYGENLFMITGASASPERVVKAWDDESRDFDYTTNRCRGKCGHYTQIIWGDTKEVGCAVARGGGREVWVCEYNPPGNWVGRRPY